jgi:hypothetical protein
MVVMRGWTCDALAALPQLPGSRLLPVVATVSDVQWQKREVGEMKTMLILMAVLLGGCSQLAAVTPSLQYCERVQYERNGNQITLRAECSAPIGGGMGL